MTTVATPPSSLPVLTLEPGHCVRLGALLNGAPERLPAGVSGVLQVVGGALWITWPGEPSDHFLAAGQQVRLPRRLAGILLETEPRLVPGPAWFTVLPLDCGSSCAPTVPKRPSLPGLTRPWALARTIRSMSR